MEKEFCMKVYVREHGTLVAVCDKELIGKRIKWDKQDVEIHISPNFYGKAEAGAEEVLAALRTCVSANFFGEKAVGLGIKAGLIEKEQSINIEGIPHAQAVVMQI